MCCEAAQVLVEPVVGVPGIGCPLQFPREVGDHATEGRLDGIKGRRPYLQPFDDAGRERHCRFAVRDKPHQGRPFATSGFQSGQADGADGKGMKVRD